ncbi:MAG: MerR family transcriptional regulator [Methylotenera sp.]|jgi:hypothetical protein|nr:MerR family transcriptional regulator [Methylotenera sp.]
MKSKKNTSVRDWFDAKAAARLSELTLDMINYLCRHELVIPSNGNKRGRGTSRRYSFADILLLRVIAKLLVNGISPLRLKNCLLSLHGRAVEAKGILTTKYVVTDGYNIYFQDDGVVELLATGQMTFAFVLELSKLREEVTANIVNGLKVA